MMEPILERFTGDLDAYMPLLIGNGDLGGTFDPFCGTLYDELKAGGGKSRDVRTVLIAGIKAQDYWELLTVDPGRHTFNPGTDRSLRERARAGLGYPRAMTRGTPFQFHVRPAKPDFLGRVRNHEQRLDVETGLLTSRYDCGGDHYETELFVHPKQSLFVYRFGGTGAQQVTLVPDWPEPDAGFSPESYVAAPAASGVRREGDVLFVKARSNIYCPACIAAACDGGSIEGTTFTCPPGSVLTIAYGHQSIGRPETLAEQTLREARNRGADKLKADLLAWWSNRWGRSFVRIPDAWMQTLYDRSLYYIISSQPRTTADAVMSEAGLSASFEAFTASMFPGWGGFGHTGPLYAGGHTDLTENLMNWYCRTLGVMKESARTRFLRGAHMPMFCGPGGFAFNPGHSFHILTGYEYHPNGYAALTIVSHLQALGWPEEATRRLYEPLAEYAELFVSMLTETNGRLEQHFAPVHTMAESAVFPEARNFVDILAPAKGAFVFAARAAERLGMRDAAVRWRTLAGKVDLSIVRDPEQGYLYAEGQREFKSKVGAALIVTHFPTGAEHDADGVLKTYRRIKRDEVFGGCGFDRSFQAIALTHVGAAKEALEALAGQADPRGELIDPACIAFRESGTAWIGGGLRGRMPYFHTSHGFYAYAIQQMLMQDYTGELKRFPACPWPEAEFALWSEGRLVEGRCCPK
jgi:hypothetical protein